jgi:hypothetical protein
MQAPIIKAIRHLPVTTILTMEKGPWEEAVLRRSFVGLNPASL